MNSKGTSHKVAKENYGDLVLHLLGIKLGERQQETVKKNDQFKAAEILIQAKLQNTESYIIMQLRNVFAVAPRVQYVNSMYPVCKASCYKP